MRARALLVAFACALPQCTEDAPPNARIDSSGLRVGVLVANGVDDVAVAAALGVFAAVAPGTDRASRVTLLSDGGGAVTTRAGATLGPTTRWSADAKHDVFVIAAIPPSLSFRSEERNRFEITCLRPARWILAAGAETFALAPAQPGRVDGLSFVVQDRVVCSAGGANTVDAALFIVERTLGELAAIEAGRALGIRWSLDRVQCAVLGAGDGPGLRVGQSLPPDASVVDAEQRPLRILDLVRPDDRVLVVCSYGGATAKGGTGKAGLWCEDSFFEMAQVRHAMAVFAGEPVRFVGIACPPAFHEEKFGYAAGGFVATHPGHAGEVTRFIDATRAAHALGLLPFDALYVDPTSHLMKKDAAAPLAQDGAGALRAPDETQAYGTPTLWIFDRGGKVLAPPFHGNNWEKNRELRFTARDIEDAIRAALSAAR
jgi:hypothetical protein